MKHSNKTMLNSIFLDRRFRVILVVFAALHLTPLWASERVILGRPSAVPMAASTDPVIAQHLASLRKKVSQNASMRLIIGLRVPFAVEGSLSAADVAQQRSEIAAAHNSLIDNVLSSANKADKTKRFETIPFLALEATATELEQLAALTDVVSIEEDHLAAPTLAESVPLVGGSTAWASGYTGSGRTVAVLDTGVDTTHPFLAGKVVSEACYSRSGSASGYTYSTLCPGGVTSSTAAGSALPYSSGVCPSGKCDHGTHVAGIVAGNNGSIFGVARNASIISVQVFSRFDGTSVCSGAASCALTWSSDQILGLERVYALRTTYNIDAVNMSLGGGRYYNQATCDSSNAAVKTAIDNLRSVNIATVIASGNNGYSDSMSSPGCISTAISVGATWDVAGGNNGSLGTSTVDSVAYYSNSVSFLNLLAPGSLINSSTPNSTYANYNGTSMATPHVAGAWAVLKQKAPTATVDKVFTALRSSGVSVTDTRNSITKPRISLPSALAAIGSGANLTPILMLLLD